MLSGGASRSVKPAEADSWSLVEKVRSMFSWIAGQVTREAREEEEAREGEASARRLLSQYSTRDLIRKAESSIAQVELSKQVLLQEFGSRAQAFVDRYINPVIVPIQSFIQSIREGTVARTIKGAVESVELLAILQDETRLRRRIRDSLEIKTRDVILEDIAFILSYPAEALGDAYVPSAGRGYVLREIEEALQPILMELESLLSARPPSYECLALFQWREAIDVKRQHLHDSAMQVIDEKVRRGSPYWRSLRDLSAKEISPFLEELELSEDKDRAWTLSIFELEEISAHLREIVEEEVTSRQDKGLKTLVDQMKAHIGDLLASEEGEEHEEALSRIMEQIEAIEALLGHHSA